MNVEIRLRARSSQKRNNKWDFPCSAFMLWLQAMGQFQAAKDTWYKTWNPEENNGEGAAMAVDYIRVWASDVIKE